MYRTQPRQTPEFRKALRSVYAFYLNPENHHYISEVAHAGDPRPLWDALFECVTGESPDHTFDTPDTNWPGQNDPCWNELIHGDADILGANERALKILKRTHAHLFSCESIVAA